jgi:hypothetical protein
MLPESLAVLGATGETRGHFALLVVAKTQRPRLVRFFPPTGYWLPTTGFSPQETEVSPSRCG